MMSAWGRVPRVPRVLVSMASLRAVKSLIVPQFTSSSRLLATTATATKKTITKAAVPKKTATTTKKTTTTATKAKKDAAAKPAAKRTTAKPVYVPVKRNTMTPEERADKKQKDLIKHLKEVALDPPSTRPTASNWITFVQDKFKEHKGSGKGLAVLIKENIDAWKSEYDNMTPAQKEALKARTDKKKEANVDALQDWVSSHTPAQIYEANKARLRLRRFKAADPQPKGLKSLSFPNIPDARFPKRPRSAAVLFGMERMASKPGDAKVDILMECMKGFKDLPEAEKKKYQDLARKDAIRYHKEMKTIGIDIEPSSMIA